MELVEEKLQRWRTWRQNKAGIREIIEVKRGMGKARNTMLD